MGKLPSIQFYPADWRKDPGVQALDYFEKGVWLELLFIMFESKNRGFLEINGQKIETKMLAKMLGLTAKKTQKILNTLAYFDVYSVNENGVIYSRRMVSDERIRQIRIKAGATGGQANASNLLKQKQQQKTPPSSTSSITTSTKVSTDDKSSVSSEPKTLTQSKRIKWSVDSSWIDVSEEDKAKWSEAFPACDINRELAAMTAWMTSNPKKAKKSNYARFITAWLTRSQDRGGGLGSAQGPRHKTGYIPATDNPENDWDAVVKKQEAKNVQGK